MACPYDGPPFCGANARDEGVEVGDEGLDVV
jgi:hypothetical protein